MTSSFFDDIDVDLNHFENLYPNLIHNRNNQYYDDDRFNSTLASNDCVRDLSVVHLNIRSINANGSDFITYLSLLNRKFDVVCLSETFKQIICLMIMKVFILFEVKTLTVVGLQFTLKKSF